MSSKQINDLNFLNSDIYVRERISPQPGDEFYIPLSDTLMAIRSLVDINASKILDYGCGGSPYRNMFSGNYVRADIELNPNRDITVGQDSLLPPDLGGFDLVLSSQVLEHVENPDSYLSECFRVLNPNGALFLSTHGLYEDHGSPDDFWRWTAHGLAKQVKRNGFKIKSILKTTCGPRAAMFFLERDLKMMGPGRNVIEIFPTLFAIIRKIGQRNRHIFADRRYAHVRICDANDQDGPTRYVGIALLATRSE